MSFIDYRVFDLFHFVSIDRKKNPLHITPTKTKITLTLIIQMCYAQINQLLMLSRSQNRYKKEV